MRPAFSTKLTHDHAKRVESGLLRRVRTAGDARPGRIVLDGRELIDFGSNDYLGLARHPRLIEALTMAATIGVGARASHLLGGHHDAHEALQRALAEWIGYPRALLFSTGYMAATGALSALLGRHDLCVQDRLNHACLIDGARLAGADLRRFAHADAVDAARLLASRPDQRALLVSDSVFSMDGDVAPLAELAALAQRERAWLMVDEAHGLGVLGPQGRGACAAAGLAAHDVPVWMGTLGKALGGFGAVIAGSEALIDALVNSARSYIYTTALPPALAQAMVVAVGLAREADAERAHLQTLVAHFRIGACELGWKLLPSVTPIQPLIVGTSADAVDLSRQLEAAGFYCPAVRPPTVPKGSARLRISLSAAHTVEDVDALLQALGKRESAGHV
ncbi:MAG: 8-amino-7-oxononanoate synthase [Rhodanobacteraceae bacterium]|nr:8-amino-7-oxononanoate synthase [Rhodanobacteraceae bacterium]